MPEPQVLERQHREPWIHSPRSLTGASGITRAFIARLACSVAFVSPDSASVSSIRPCRPDEQPAILAIVNAAAERYRDVIPADCWHEPYMSSDQLERDIAAGVRFWGAEGEPGELLGVMGIQPVKDVHLIRHAYVRPEVQGQGIGGTLLRFLERQTDGQILIGTWAAASWAIAFYERHGYTRVPPERAPELLRTYWSVSPRQVETSVVLAKPPRGLS